MAAPKGFVDAFRKIYPTARAEDIEDLWKEISPYGRKGGKGGFLGVDDEDLFKRLQRELKTVNNAIDRIDRKWYHQRDIIDDIEATQADINNLMNEEEEVLKKITDDKEKERKKAEYDLDIARERLRLAELEQRKRIDGYNRIDRFESDFKNRTNQLRKGVNEIRDGVKQIGDSVNKLVGPWAKISQASADYAKNIGLSGKAMDYLRKSSIDLVSNRGIGIKYNTSVEELLGLQQGFTKNVGRQVGLTYNDLETLAATSKILGNETTADFMAKFEKFGLSMSDAGDRAGKMFADASKRGIAWENYSKNFLDNITLAQRYTFRNGTRGLESMARKATEINLNMSQAASFAEKVNTVEGAIRTGAQLQVLGGPFAQMADPIGMLYESLNDMESLQDRMVQMFGNLGSFNRQTGEVEISAFNRMRIREAARSMGIDEANIFESINSNARRNEIANQLRGNNNGLTQEVMDLVKNTGTIRNGVAGVTINGQFKAANQITNADQKYLMEISRSESDDVKDIAQRLRGWDDYMQGFTKQKDATQAQLVESMGIGMGIQRLVGDVGEMKAIMKALAIGTMGLAVGGAIAGGFGMVKGGSHVVGGLGSALGFRGHRLQHGNGNAAVYNTDAWGRWLDSNGKVASRARSKALDKSFAQAVEKTGGEGLTKFEGKGLTTAKAVKAARISTGVAKGANIAGWAGLAGDLATNYMVSSGKWRKGGTGDYLGNILSGAAEWGGLGGTIGAAAGGIGAPIGAIIGALAGGVNGAFTAGKHRLGREVSENTGLDLYGNYSYGELKKIKAALNGEGEISGKLREKMQMRGDAEMLNKIDSITKSIISDGAVRTRVVGAQKKAGGGIVQGTDTSGQDNTVVMSNPREMMLNEGQQAQLFNAISTGNFNNITPRVEPVSVEPPVPPVPQTMKIEFGRLDINFKADDIKVVDQNGTAKNLDLDIDGLRKQIEQSLMLKISEHLERMEHAGRLVPNKGYFYQQK